MGCASSVRVDEAAPGKGQADFTRLPGPLNDRSDVMMNMHPAVAGMSTTLDNTPPLAGSLLDKEDDGDSSSDVDSEPGQTVAVVIGGTGGGVRRPSPVHAHFELRPGCMPRKVFITPTVMTGTDALGNRTVNEYTVLHELGRGAFGRVDLVVSQSSDEIEGQKLYAMKECKRPPGALLTKECMILLRLQHPNIVALHEVIDDQDHYEVFLVMEYLVGGSVMTIADDGRAVQPRMQESEASRYTLQLASGLEELHSKNVVHRDIKPENIFVTRDKSTVKIGDFGTALMFRDDNDTLRKTQGTYTFYSPEMCRESTYSGKSSDIWALGVTLYCFIFGEVPFNGATAPAVFEKILHDDVPFPPCKPVSAKLRNLFERFLCKTVLRRITVNEIQNHPWILQNDRSDTDTVFVPLPDGECTPEKQPEAEDILLVEGVYMARVLIQHMFSDILVPGSCTVDVAMDGFAALAKCKYKRYSLILMDVHMARLTGYEATAGIREIEKAHCWPSAPIIGVTADNYDDISALCLAAGMDRILSKPVRMSTLARVARQYGLPVSKQCEEPLNCISSPGVFTPPLDAAKHAYMVAYSHFMHETTIPPLPTPDTVDGSQRSSRSTNNRSSASEDFGTRVKAGYWGASRPHPSVSDELSAEQEAVVACAVAREYGLDELPKEVMDAAERVLRSCSAQDIITAAEDADVGSMYPPPGSTIGFCPTCASLIAAAIVIVMQHLVSASGPCSSPRSLASPQGYRDSIVSRHSETRCRQGPHGDDDTGSSCPSDVHVDCQNGRVPEREHMAAGDRCLPDLPAVAAVAGGIV